MSCEINLCSVAASQFLSCFSALSASGSQCAKMPPTRWTGKVVRFTF